MNPDLNAEFRLSSSSLALTGLAASVPNARIKLDEVVGVDHSVFLCWVEADSYDTVEAALDTEPSIADDPTIENLIGNLSANPDLPDTRAMWHRNYISLTPWIRVHVLKQTMGWNGENQLALLADQRAALRSG